jgi:TPR repeat protein
LLFEGLGVSIDNKLAFYWFNKSKESGNLKAVYKVAQSFQYGLGVSQDLEKAFELFLQSAELGDAVSQFKVSKLYRSGTGTEVDLKKSFDWCLKSANQNHPDAVWDIAYQFRYGIGCETNLDESYHYYLLSSNLESSFLEKAKIRVHEFQKGGLTKLAHFHFRGMYWILAYNHERIEEFNDVNFNFK